uniref:Uncharacterized protein n=1 Tax=Amphimedon queenslandica TaxID=400682 RepID=A0A1X7TIT2_AMPQE
MATNQSNLLGGQASTNLPVQGTPMQQQVPRALCLVDPNIEIPKYQNLEGLVCGSKEEDPRDVFLFGDQGIFTFSIALASLRANGSSGMTTACYKQNLTSNGVEQEVTTIPDFASKKRESLAWCIENGDPNNTWSLNLPSKAIIANIKAVLDVPDFSRTWRNDAEAIPLRIPRSLMVAGKVVWFQCPWTPRGNKSYSTSGLIQDFMREMKDRQQVGDYLLLGIANNLSYGYAKEYRLSEILQAADSGELGYKFQGGDNELIKKILGCGYKHEAFQRDIHDFIFNKHVTLVFKREGADSEGLAGKMNEMDINDDPFVSCVTKNRVVVFKEEDISFKAALANLHDKKWDEIEADYLPDDLCLSMIEQCVCSGEKLQLHSDEIILNIKALQPPQTEYAGKVVWYQLPPSSDVKMEQIKSFMRIIGKKQEKDDYLLIGTTTSNQFTDLKIEEMIGDGNEGHAYNGYTFIKMDVKLIQKITALGYKHGSREAKVLVYKKAGEGETA